MTAAPEPLPRAEVRKLAKRAGWEISTGEPLIVAAAIDRCAECDRQVGQSHTRACLTGRYAKEHHGADGAVDADAARAFLMLADTVTGVTVRVEGEPRDLGVVIRGAFHASDVPLFRKLVAAAEQGAPSEKGGVARKAGVARKPKGGTGK